MPQTISKNNAKNSQRNGPGIRFWILLTNSVGLFLFHLFALDVKENKTPWERLWSQKNCEWGHHRFFVGRNGTGGTGGGAGGMFPFAQYCRMMTGNTPEQSHTIIIGAATICILLKEGDVEKGVVSIDDLKIIHNECRTCTHEGMHATAYMQTHTHTHTHTHTRTHAHTHTHTHTHRHTRAHTCTHTHTHTHTCTHTHTHKYSTHMQYKYTYI